MSKVFLVTGTSSGIGEALISQISASGHIVFAGARDPNKIKTGLNIIPVKLDVNTPADIERVLTAVRADYGKIDVLINNAGYGAMGPLIEMPIEAVRAQFETNTFAPLNLIQKCFSLLQNSNKPVIVNIGSSAGILMVPFSGTYCASKAAIHGFSEVLRMELAALGVHVMTVYPGAVSSKFGDNATSKLSQTLIKNSIYAPIAKAIEKRARISRDSPTTPEIFAANLLAAIARDNPPAIMRIGKGSTSMPLINKFIPVQMRDKMLRKKFQLNQM